MINNLKEIWIYKTLKFRWNNREHYKNCKESILGKMFNSIQLLSLKNKKVKLFMKIYIKLKIINCFRNILNQMISKNIIIIKEFRKMLLRNLKKSATKILLQKGIKILYKWMEIHAILKTQREGNRQLLNCKTINNRAMVNWNLINHHRFHLNIIFKLYKMMKINCMQACNWMIWLILN